MNIERQLAKLLDILRRIQAMLRAPHAQRIIWMIAVLVFLGGLVVSIAAQPALIANIRIETILVVLLALCPLMTCANMLTTKELARLAGAQMNYFAAFKLAVMSTAANQLPAPGGPLLRIVAFQAAGAKLKDSTLATLAAGLIWMGATFLFAAAWAFSLNLWLSASLLGAGGVMTAAAFMMSMRLPGGALSAGRLFAVSSVSAALYAAAIYWALLSFGVSWSFGQAAVISAAGVIGAAISIVPSGLGVREAASASLAAMIGAQPAAAFTATASIHLAMLVIMGGCALFFASRNKTALAS